MNILSFVFFFFFRFSLLLFYFILLLMWLLLLLLMLSLYIFFLIFFLLRLLHLALKINKTWKRCFFLLFASIFWIESIGKLVAPHRDQNRFDSCFRYIWLFSSLRWSLIVFASTCFLFNSLSIFVSNSSSCFCTHTYAHYHLFIFIYTFHQIGTSHTIHWFLVSFRLSISFSIELW